MNISSELRDRNLKAELGDNLCARAADEIERLTAENERLRGVIKRHWNFAAFVHLWVNRDKVTDAERVDVIKHHPSLKEWIEGDNGYQQQPVNMPFERLPQHAHDPGFGPVPPRRISDKDDNNVA